MTALIPYRELFYYGNCRHYARTPISVANVGIGKIPLGVRSPGLGCGPGLLACGVNWGGSNTMTTRIDAVCRTARHQGSSEVTSGVGVAPSITEPGFMALSAAWPQYTYLELRALPTAVSCARLHARHVLWEWGLDDLAEVSALLVSELMTNAYKTTVEQRLAAPIRLRLSSTHDHVLIEVWDGDPVPPQPRSDSELPSADAESGRGLFLVATLSHRWNWYTVPRWGGKVVWAEVIA